MYPSLWTIFFNLLLQTVEYVLRDMRHPGGGVYAAEDADSVIPPQRAARLPKAPWVRGHTTAATASLSEGGHGGSKAEGAFYVWTRDEVVAALGENPTSQLACDHYGLQDGDTEGNAGSNPGSDPHGELYGVSVLAETGTVAATAATLADPAAAASSNAPAPAASAAESNARIVYAVAALQDARRKLLAARDAVRARPHRDEKILVAWNGQMMSAMARAAVTVSQPPEVLAASLGPAVATSPGAGGLLRLSPHPPDGSSEHYLPGPRESADTLYQRFISGARDIAQFVYNNLTVAAVAAGQGQPAPEPVSARTRLLRSWCDGAASPVTAFLDDYASLIDGLIELHAAGGDEPDGKWLAWAFDLQVSHAAVPL